MPHLSVASFFRISSQYIYSVQILRNMRALLFTYCLLTAFSLRATEPKDALKSRLDSLQYYASVYDTMNPYVNNQQHVEKLYDYQQRIVAILLEVLNNAHYVKLDPSKQINFTGLSHTVSNDNRIHLFSIDEKTGGSFRSNITIIFINHNKIYKARVLPPAYVAYFFSGVYQTDSTRYIAMGTVTSCNTCVSAVAMEISFDRGEELFTTELSIDCRYPDLFEFNYNDTTKVISYHFGTRSDDSMYGEVSGNRQEPGHQPWMIHESGEYTWRNGMFRRTAHCTSTELLDW